MKLTKTQKRQLFNSHNGVGFIAVKQTDNEINQIEFFVNARNEVCIINDNLPADKIDLNQFVLKDLQD